MTLVCLLGKLELMLGHLRLGFEDRWWTCGVVDASGPVKCDKRQCEELVHRDKLKGVLSEDGKGGRLFEYEFVRQAKRKNF